MRVLHVIPSIADRRGGPSAAVCAIARELTAIGCHADITTTDDDGDLRLSLPVNQWIMHNGARVWLHRRSEPPLAQLREFQHSSTFASWLSERLDDYDVVHVHALFSFLPSAAMRLCRQRSQAFVLRPLGMLDPWSLAQRRRRKQAFLAAVDRRNISAANALHCTSVQEAAGIARRFPKARTVVVPHGCDPMAPDVDATVNLRRRYGLPADEPVALFLSRWAPKKNIPLLLDALRLHTGQRWTLLLAGTGNPAYAETIQRQIDELGLRDRVVCPGHLGGDDKRLALNGATAFVLPSSTENFGLALAEALCAGLPCVATQGVDSATAVERLRAGRVCEPTTEAVGDALAAVLQTSWDRERIRNEARSEFDWHQTALQLNSLYQRILAEWT